MRVSLAAVVVAALVVGSSESHAQLCLGAASFSAGPMRLGAAVNVGDQVKGYGAEFAVGQSKGAFGSVGVTSISYDGVSGNSTSFDVSAGYSVDTDSKGKAQFCPVAQFAHEKLPDFDEFESSANSFGLGGALGGILSSSPSFDFVPFVSGMFVRSTVSASGGGFDASASENYGVLSMGAGFVMNHTVTLRPTASFPVGLEGAKPSFGLSLGFNFGSR
jgi:hypothetical protein